MSNKGTTVGRGDLVTAMAKRTGLSQAKCNDFIGDLVGEITNNLKKGNRVTITGFGTFETRKRAARTGHNPATGATLKIKANTVPAFKAGATLKAAVGRK